MLPLSHSGRVRAPWPPSSCARLPYPSSRPVTGATSAQLGSATLSAAFADSRVVAFTSRFPAIDRDLRDIAFDHSASMSPDRVLGVHATPLASGAKEPPGRQPTCARFLHYSTHPNSRMNLSPEPQTTFLEAILDFRRPSFNLTVLRAM
jgi:hypothetical protein